MKMRPKRTSRVFSLTPAVVALLLGGGSVFSAQADPNYRPEWSHPWEVTSNPNCSFLNDTRQGSEVSVLDELIDRHTALDLRQRYQDMSRDYELKRSYGLVDSRREQQRGDEVNDFGRQIVGEVQRYQTARNTEKLKTAVDRDPDLQVLAKPAAVVAAGAAVYRGTPMNLRLNEDTKLRAVTNVRNQTSEFSLLSPVVTTSVGVNLSKPEDRDPTQPPDPDPTHQIERYHFSFSRGLPIWDLSSGLSYGGTTSSVSASLSKRVTNNLTAEVDSIRPIKQGYYNEECLKLNYGLQF